LGYDGNVYKDLQRDASIIRVLERLHARLGPGAFEIVDHWEGDRVAIGVAKPDCHSLLAYISTLGMAEDSYWVSLEFPPEPESELPYTQGNEREVTSFEELVEIIQRHFASANRRR